MKNFSRLMAAFALALGGLWSMSAQAQEPIVFVHGYSGSNSNWDTMVSRFISSGYPSNKLYRFGYSSLTVSNTISAAQLEDFVDGVRAANGNSQVSIVAHSNGNLVTRWYRLFDGGLADNRRYVALGAPHFGTTFAYACYSPACYEMRPYSSFLLTIGASGCDRSIYSTVDGVIIPYTSAICGQSTRTASVSHLALLTDSRVYSDVRAALQ